MSGINLNKHAYIDLKNYSKKNFRKVRDMTHYLLLLGLMLDESPQLLVEEARRRVLLRMEQYDLMEK